MAASLSGCATAPDPAKVCTAKWIAPRADKAVSRIEKRAKSSIKALTKAGESWAKGKTPGPLTMMALSGSVKKLEKELTQGQGIQDLRMLAKTCNDPEIVTTSVRNLLQRNGVSDRFIAMAQGSPLYEKIMGSVLDDRGTKT